ncbi:MAG: hypothetical protein GXP61_02645 [Epsilonproteobacteria bacterium]|nr:hypothetical protein [Campylobacterota bacterium]
MISNGLYSVKFKNDKEVIVKLSDKNNPIFKAHFPQRPIMPGFIHFEIISDLFGLNITTIKRAKFLKLIEPNQVLTYKRDGRKFQVFCKEEIVASFIL